MKWNKLYKYPKSIRETLKGGRHYDVNDEKLPSLIPFHFNTPLYHPSKTLSRIIIINI